MQNVPTRLRLVLVAVAVIAAGFLLKTVRVPVTIKAPCYVCAAAEWHLGVLQADKLGVELISRRPPIGKRHIQVFQFAREDFVSYISAPDVSRGKCVEKGQVVGRIRSMENERLLQETLAQIEGASARLALVKAGAKEEIVEQARWNLKRAADSESLAASDLSRTEGLFARGLAAEGDLDLAMAEWKGSSADVKIAEAELAEAESGEREEAQEIALHALEYLKVRAERLDEKIGWLEIRSPFRGEVASRVDTTEIFCVLKTDTMAVEIPVHERHIHLIRTGQEFVLKVRGLAGRSLKGTVEAIDCRATEIAGQSRVIVTGSVCNEDSTLCHGVSGEAEIHCGRYSLPMAISVYITRDIGIRW
jgi:multidrug efflux pump subunit AcrA (membrane-fusion protein)